MNKETGLGFHEETNWRCSCGGELTTHKVAALYLGNRFEIELPACSRCGFILVPESLAVGKMLEVEKILEDK